MFCEDTAAHAVLALLNERAHTARRVAKITPVEMARVLGVTSDTVRSALYDLYDDGDVERVAEGEYVMLVRHVCETADLSHHGRGAALTASSKKHAALGRRSTTRSASMVSPCPDGQGELESSYLTSTNAAEEDADEKPIDKAKVSSGPGWEHVPETRLSSRPVDCWNGLDFAVYFKDEVFVTAGMRRIALGPNPVNFKALKGNFAKWRKEGIPNSVIKEMVDLFMDDLPRRIMKGTPVWRLFISYRTALYRQVEQMAQDARHEEAGTEYWTASRVDDDIDISHWIGAR